MQLLNNLIELKAQISELQKGHDHDRLAEIQGFLDLDDFSEEEHRKQWARHVQAVDTDDDLNAEILQQMCGTELHTFRAGEEYQSWSNSEQSSLLVLSGYNNDSIELTYQCWASPVAARLVEDFDKQKSRPFYAYYAVAQNGKLLHDVLSVILLQLLKQKSSALRDEQRYSELRTKLRNFRQMAKDDKERVKAMRRVAVRVVDFFDEPETVYIVVDRADRCWKPDKAYHRKMLLKVLVEMVEQARCKLKVLVVVDGRSWPKEKYRDDVGVKMNERFVVCSATQPVRDD
ncbi:MAG: hypothetical protein Q9195_007935 [Heterodermia aff. obscurata]